jgi:hypothetical protein
MGRHPQGRCLISRVIPLHITADLTHQMLTPEESEAKFRERGLPMDLLERLRMVPVRLNEGEDEDPYRQKVIDVMRHISTPWRRRASTGYETGHQSPSDGHG